MTELQAIVARLCAAPHEPTALATLLTVQGSSYRRPGARLLITAAGDRLGSISGGCLEEDLLARAQRVLGSGRAEAVVYDTTSENDVVWGVGLGCHGVVRILIERLAPEAPWIRTLADNFAARRPTELAVVHDGADPGIWGTRLADQAGQPHTSAVGGVYRETVTPPPSLVIFGAGDDARPLVALAKEIGWHVTVADPRAAFATRERFPSADVLRVAAAAQLVEEVSPEPGASAVIMTHHYVHDVPLLRALLGRPLRYVGLLGPRKRAEKILGDLAAAGVLPAPGMKLHAPVGLDLGADAPPQVALAIVAEIQAVLAGRNARPLRERAAPIHG